MERVRGKSTGAPLKENQIAKNTTVFYILKNRKREREIDDKKESLAAFLKFFAF